MSLWARIKAWFADGDDFIDGCDAAKDGLNVLLDEDIVWEVLFASVRYQGLAAILKRGHEWRVLFAGEAP